MPNQIALEIAYCGDLYTGDGLIGCPDFDCRLGVTVRWGAWDVPEIEFTHVWIETTRRLRNHGRPGITFIDGPRMDALDTAAGPMWRTIGEHLKHQAEEDANLYGAILDEAEAAARENRDCDRYHQRRDEELLS